MNKLKLKLKSIMEKTDNRPGFVFDSFIQVMVVLSLLAYSIETLSNLSAEVEAFLHWFELCSVIVFTLEYLLRVYVATPRSKYIFSFFGVIDLLAVLPYFVGFSMDMRSLRAFRLLRLFRIFKFARYSSAAHRFHIALNIVQKGKVSAERKGAERKGVRSHCLLVGKAKRGKAKRGRSQYCSARLMR